MSTFSIRHMLMIGGYSPIPVDGKRPAPKQWEKKLETSDDEIKLWDSVFSYASSTGILTRFVPTLDIDILNTDAAEAVEALVRERFEDGGYILVRIGRAPKRAIPFRTNDPFKKITCNLIAPNGDTDQKIELLGDGQQFVAFGIHEKTGQPYRWHGGQPGEIKREELPYIHEEEARKLVEDAAELLCREHGYRRAETRAKANANGADHSDGAGDWSYLTANIIAGRELHDSLLALAGKLVKSGMSKGAAINHLRGLMDNSTAPRDARWKDRRDDIPRLVEGATPGKAPPRAPATTTENIMGKKYEPVKYVVPGIIVEGLTLFAGKPKIGKSWLLLHVAVSVGRGTFTLGDIKCPQGAVLYCALEDNERRLQSRLRKLFGHDWQGKVPLTFRTEMPRLADGGLALIEQWIEATPDARLVIIDTLAMVKSPKKLAESNYDADYASVQALRTMALRRGIAIVVVHHLRKQEADDPYDLVSGTLGLTGAPDSVLVLMRDSSGKFVLHGHGRDMTEIEKAVIFNADSCTWTILGDAAVTRQSDERGRVLVALEEAGEPLGPNDIAAATQMKPVNVRALLVKMLRDNTIEKAEYGRYRARVTTDHIDHTDDHTATNH